MKIKENSLNDFLKSHPVLKDVKEKELLIKDALLRKDKSTLIKLGISYGGFLNDKLRADVWPVILNIGLQIQNSEDCNRNFDPQLVKDYEIIYVDVKRTLKRCPSDFPSRKTLQKKLIYIITKILLKYPHLHYYQGYHDVALTLLLIIGEKLAFPILEKITLMHFKDFMAYDMQKTIHFLSNIYPLISKQNNKVCNHLLRSEVGVVFCLPWVITWFSHEFLNEKIIARIFDYFICAQQGMSLYLSAAIVLSKESQILAEECDMAAQHYILQKLPEDLPFEDLISVSNYLAFQFPLYTLEAEVGKYLVQLDSHNFSRKIVCKKNKYNIINVSICGLILIVSIGWWFIKYSD